MNKTLNEIKETREKLYMCNISWWLRPSKDRKLTQAHMHLSFPQNFETNDKKCIKCGNALKNRHKRIYSIISVPFEMLRTYHIENYGG